MNALISDEHDRFSLLPLAEATVPIRMRMGRRSGEYTWNQKETGVALPTLDSLFSRPKNKVTFLTIL